MSAKYAEEIGADAYSKDAASAAAVAKKRVSLKLAHINLLILFPWKWGFNDEKGSNCSSK